MAPYAVAHFKLGLELAARDLDELWRDQWAYEFHPGERLNIFLTNTLDDAGHKFQTLLGPAAAISAEAQAAAAVKSKLPVLVVMGNPPYSNFGQLNRNEWILGLLDDYKRDLNEKKINLDDDFIKFIRWAQWRIAQTGSGIVAFITSNVYLDGITHRRMREALLEAFDEIHVVNLHGSSKKMETAPGGGKDDNVFDITVGVALVLFVKLPAGSRKSKKAKLASIRHADLWGTRKHKYAWLDAHDLTDTKWTKLYPNTPNFWFVPKDESQREEYEEFWSLRDAMPTSNNGFKTDRDGLVIDFDRHALEVRMRRFFSDELPSGFRETYNIRNSTSYDIESRREKLSFDKKFLRRCVYRPFDIREIYYDPKLISRPADKVMAHLLAGPNLALCCLRQSRRGESGAFFVADGLVNKDVVSLYDIGTVFPLYLYPREQQPDEFIVEEGDGPTPNLAPKFIEEFSAKLKLKFVPLGVGDRKNTFGPEDVLHYAYAIFHAPSYRTRYAEFLRVDFPRLPLTANQKLFRQLCEHGKRLVELHLLKVAGSLHVSFPEKGDNSVQEVTCTPPHGSKPGRVQINDEQYFENIPPEVWAFHVGGYQVCEKWLKDRRGRQLTIDERDTYPRIVAALAETLRLQSEIDAALAAAGGWPLA